MRFKLQVPACHYILAVAALFCLTMPLCGSTPINQTILEDDFIRLELQVRDTASLADDQWLQFTLVNKSNYNIRLDRLDYRLDGFEELEDGTTTVVPAAYAKGNKQDLLHRFHLLSERSIAAKNFSLQPHEHIDFWKHPSTTGSVAIEAQQKQSGELCALVYVELEYSFKSNNGNKLQSENIICTHWVKMSETDITRLVERFERAVVDVQFIPQQIPVLSLLTDLTPVLDRIDPDILVQGVISRSTATDERERLLLLRCLDVIGQLNHTELKDHYLSCMKSDNCQWQNDLQIYWNNALIDPLLRSRMYVNQVALLLELHAHQWKVDKTIRQQIFDYLQKQYRLGLDAPIDANSFEDWYNTIKYLVISRHRDLLDYLKPLLDNKETYTVKDWSMVGSNKVISKRDVSKARTVRIRICDVAYVALLRFLDQIVYTNEFVRKKIKPSLYIDPVWEGETTLIRENVQLKNPYTVLAPHLKMAEKYYYLYELNRTELEKRIQEYESRTDGLD